MKEKLRDSPEKIPAAVNILWHGLKSILGKDVSVSGPHRRLLAVAWDRRFDFHQVLHLSSQISSLLSLSPFYCFLVRENKREEGKVSDVQGREKSARV